MMESAPSWAARARALERLREERERLRRNKAKSDDFKKLTGAAKLAIAAWGGQPALALGGLSDLSAVD